MKKIIQLLLVLFTVSMTSQSLDKNWNKVYEFEYAGKIKSASEELNKIYKKARRDNNKPEIIRTFIYQSKFLQTLEEEAQYKIIENLKREFKTKDVANKAIFNFIYGKLLNEYYTQNIYQLKQRTATDTLFNLDFRTWSHIDFEKEIAKAFQNSIENETVLLKTPLSDYEKIIVFGKYETDLNQSLYDFLTEKYLAYEKNNGTESEEGIAFFTNNIDSFYGETKDFQQLNFEKFKSSLFYKKLSIYQKLERSYSSQNNALALSSIILKRVRTIYQKEKQKEEYLAHLDKHIQRTNSRYKSAFLLEKAKTYQDNASKTANIDYNSKAIAICDEVISRNEEPYLSQAKQIKAGILYKNLSITTEKYIVPNQPNLALVQFKDVDTIYGALYKIPLKFDIENSYYDSEYYYNNEKKKYINRDSIFIAFANKTKPYKTFQNILPNKNDHFQYSTEVVFPEVETGTYLLMMNIKKDSLSEEATYSYTILNASQLTLLYSTSNNIENFQVLNRKTGKPIEKVILKSEDYSLTTDLNGSATYQRTSQLEDNYKKIFAIRENDTLVQSYYSGYYDYRNNENEDFKAKVNLFTDRAIYRPGQTVYLKGILSQMKDRQHSVVPNMHISVTAEDANGQEIYEARLKTNEFGSFIGEFTIPKNVLTGNFTIYTNEDKDYETDEHYNKKTEEHPFWDEVDFQESEINFQVEEYKRPKFEITFEPIKENFIVNQTIKIKGKAKAFAGSNISNAEVSYTVNRNSYYNNWYYSRHYNNYDNTQITEGKTKTDENGNFEIEFTATPADDFDEKGLPIFNFTINADVTDINGENRSNNTEAKVGYHTLILTAEVPSIISSKSQETIPVNSQNLNGQFVPTTAEIKIYKLISPNRVLNNRPWQAPEIQTIPENEFAKLFPSKPYTDENETSKWKKGNLVFNEKINTETTKEIVLKDLKKWTSGEYQLFFTSKDAFGKEIEILSNFKLVNNEDKKLTDSQLFHYEVINKNPGNDGFIEMQFSSATPLLYVATDAFYKSNSVYTKVIEVNGKKTFRIPIGNDWKKEVKITMNFVLENESYNRKTAIYLPEFKETMSIETISLRNKIEPGGNETWSFLIKNQDNKGIPAEVLATMYDASLDQFSKSSWDTELSIYYNEYNNIISKQFLGFMSNKTAYFKNLNSAATAVYYHPTQINWFGFDFMRPSQYNAEYQRYLTEKLVQTNGATIRGIVSDDSGPLHGVTVTVTGTERSTVTDMDGKYEIKAFIGEFLEFNFIGMVDQFAKVSNRVMDINMATNASTLEEVVVTAYSGAVKKSNITGSVTIVSAESIKVEADASFDQVLQGSAPGLYVASGNGQPGSMATVRIRGTHSISGDGNPLYILDGNAISAEEFSKLNSGEISAITVLKGASATSIYGSKAANGAIIVTTKKSLEALSEVKARKNLSETAFFLPQLQTDANGNLKFSFTSPEALTQWKLRLLAHNKKTASAYLESSIITQKDLMILPNVPRFLREKDTIIITSKIANITSEAKTGIAMLQLFDAVTMKPIDTKMLNSDNVKNFNIKANGNTVVSWKLFIPEGLQGVQYKILAKAGNFTDGEENILPVLTNSILVTESMPLWVPGNTKKEYTFENFKNNQSTTLRNHLLTLEYTSNPAWYAIQSLPYLMEYEHECAEQTFSRYYANTLANEIVTSNPKIAAVFEAWKKSGKPISKLEQNEELKSLILAETPWIRNAASEEQQKKNLALLFDLEKMKTNINDNFEKLYRKQSTNGGFSWFSGGNDSEYITRHIVTGLGHLEKLKISNQSIEKFRRITTKAVPFIDEKFLNRDKELELYKKKNKIWNYDTYADLHFLYARSFYIEVNPIGDSLRKVITKHLDYTKNNWLQYGLYQKAMAALVLNRFGEKEKAKNILVNLKETAINNEENGMYWIDNKMGWYWYQAPVEIQALLIEAFSEVGNDKKSVEAMKVWLLKNRETKSWSTTKATTEAIYALLLQGEDWISVKDNTVIKLGDEKIMTKKLAENEKEAGSGYIKMNWKADEITKDMATISINNKSNITGFGGFYWQYFEDLDKIKSSQESPMTIEKELYIKENTSKGKELQKTTNGNTLKIGDLVTVRLIIYTKEDMEFVHLKDMRASAFEPVNVISEYKWQDGLGYYMSTKDASTHFFFDIIRKGKYVLEYDIRVNSQGEFSNGITTIQSMYAPEFSSHSQGIRVKVSE